MEKEIKCWVVISEEGEFEVAATRKEARIKQQGMKGFEIEAKIKKAVLIIK